MANAYASDFEGWWPVDTDEAIPIACPSSQTFATYGPYADCLPSGSSAFPTACSTNVLSYNNDGEATCGPSASCYTMTVAPTSPIDTTSLTTRYMCAQTDWTFDTLYWAYQEQTGYPAPSTSVYQTAAPSTSTPSTVTSSTSTSSTFTSSISTSLPTSTSTTLPDSTTSDQSGSSLSGGAIAGIVIGCFAAAILLAGFLLRRYRLPPFSKRIDPTNELPELPEQNQVHEIGSSGSPPQKSNTVYEIGS